MRPVEREDPPHSRKVIILRHLERATAKSKDLAVGAFIIFTLRWISRATLEMTYTVVHYLKVMRSHTPTSSFRETSERNPRSLVSWNPLH